MRSVYRSEFRNVVRWLLVVAVAGMGLAVAPGSVGAQPIEIWPPAPPMPSIDGISIDEHVVRAVIDGPIAEVTVTQVFRNESGRLAEGTFLFPLPDDAAVGDFQMTVNGEVLEGRLMESDAARRIYEETVRQIRDPALLEYAGRGLFQTSVFPIPPGESRTLQFRYGVLLDAENGLHRFSYPLRVPGSSRPALHTELTVEIASEDGVRAVYSPSHDVAIERGSDDAAIVRFEAENQPLASDFALYFGLGNDAIGLNLISHRPAGEEGYFVLLAAPSIDVEVEEVAQRDVVFVLDVSGSMEGPKLAQAKEAVRYVVEHLNAGDRFNLIAFSTGATLWSDRLADVTAEHVDDALAWIDGLDASGSTDINRAVLEALAQIDRDGASGGSPSYVLFMTDGMPTQGETDIGKILRNAQDNLPGEAVVRLFTFGVGFDVNTDLLDTLSQEMGGRSRYVRPDEQIDEAVSEFYATIQTPVLTDVEVELGDGVLASDTYPYPIPDLFAGEQLVVTGRYREGGEANVALSGRVGDERVRFVYPELSLVNAGGEPFVARLWATRKIGALMEQIRRQGPDPEVVDAIVDLSMRYGIVTPYTSYLVEEPESIPLADMATGQPGPMPRRDLLADAQARVLTQAEAAAAAPASGAAAVEASEAREKLRSAESVVEHQELRFAGGKTFVSQGRVAMPDGSEKMLWVDTAYSDDMELETVAFASERYFELARQPELAEILALSSEIVVAVDDAHAIRVSAAEDAASAGANDDAHAGASVDQEEASDSVWSAIWEWLAGKGRR